MISRFFIDRPIFAAVISIVIVIAGAVALAKLPIAQYPEITPPVVVVTANYPGANADVVSQNVAAPIELQVNGVDHMLYMNSSSSSTGQMELSVFFEIGTNPDLAQVNVQNRVNLALPTLPDTVKAQGVKVEKRSSTWLMIIAVYSPDGRYDDTYIANYANLYVLDALKRVPGANQANILGLPDYAMRIWLKPDRMAQLGITAGDVARAVSNQNQQYAAGRLGQAPTDGPVEQTFPVTTKGRLTTPAEFEDIILRATGDAAAMVRLKDVGRAELGSKDYSLRSKINGKNTTLIAVYQQPGANALEVSKQVTKTLRELKESFPDGLDYAIALDTTKFVRASIDEVVHTFFEALILVVLVVFLFLQSFRATLIPLLAVPVSIIGTFVGMTALGFTINMLTLFGMILAIGIVVDDAIVVIENVERNMTQFNLPPKEAAKRAMDEVTGPVIAIVLVLVAVFIPVAFMGGITGQLYKQFAITIAISVVISGIVALTLSPALAALLLKPGHGTKKNRFFRWFEAMFGRVTDGYVSGVQLLMRRAALALCVFAGIFVLTYGLFKFVPSSFVPPEDQGYLFGGVMMPDAASLDRTEQVSRRGAQVFAERGGVKDVVEVTGYSMLDGQVKTNASTFFVSLKEYVERKKKEMQAPAIVDAVAQKFGQIREGFLMPLNPPSIPGLGSMGGFEFWIQSRGEGDTAKLEAVTKDFIVKANRRPELRGVSSTMQAACQQLRVDVDREKAESLGVPVGDVYDALQTVFGSLYVSQFNKFSRLWQVILQAESKYRSRPEDIDQIYVRSTKGSMVPLKSMITTSYTTGPDLVTRFNAFPAAKVMGDAAPGYSSGQALAAMEQVGAQTLPKDFAYQWSGQAYEEKKSGGTSAAAFVFGLIMVFLILAAQYEKWTLPFGVLMAVPFAIFGALGAIWLRGIENDVYFQIGLLTLVALAAKNAILIVEFAVMQHREGLSAVDAAVQAARLRLRPIVMTSLAFILGCVPLAIATGASSNSRHSIGTGVIGGMLGATLIAVFFIPLFFRLLEGASEKLSRKEPSARAPATVPEPPEPGAGGAGKKAKAIGKLILLLCALLLAGCAIGPDYQRPPVSTPDSWRIEVKEARDLANTAWWEQFDDRVLNRLVETALRENKDIKIAAARVEEFVGRAWVARSGLFPQINAQGDAGRERFSENSPSGAPLRNPTGFYDASFNGSWEIDVWGRLRRATEAARADLLSTEEGRRAVVLTLVASVASAYVNLRDLDKQLDIARRTSKSREEAYDIFKMRFEGGLISDLELSQARSEYEQAVSTIPSFERAIAQQENALSVLLGRNPGPIPRGKSIDQLALPLVPQGVPSDLLLRRPDIRQAEQDLIAANARIGVARGLYFPAISLTGLYGWSSTELSGLVSGSSQAWNFAGNVTAPIFTGGAIAGQVRQAEAVHRQVLLGYQKTIQTAFREVEDALVDQNRTRAQLEALGRQVDALRTYSENARLRYENGYTSYIDVLDAERGLFNSELSYAQTQGTLFQALVNLYKAMGGGWVVEAERMTGETADGRGKIARYAP